MKAKPKSRAADMARQRARDAEALDKFANLLGLCDITIRRYDEAGAHVDKMPKFDNWQEMLKWIRDEFGKDEMK